MANSASFDRGMVTGVKTNENDTNPTIMAFRSTGARCSYRYERSL